MNSKSSPTEQGNAPVKPIMEQLDRFEQRLTLHLQLENGETFQPLIYMRNLLKTQSLEAWNGRPEEFQAWIAEQMAQYFQRMRVHIWGHSKQAPKHFDLFWSPEGKRIATVTAPTIQQAKKQTPLPYRKFMGEVYAVEVQP